MNARWSIPAPVWNTARFMHGDKRLGAYHPDKDNPNFWTAWFDQDGVATFSPDTYLRASEARAWVEARVMEAMGATVAPDNAEWNEAIEAAARLYERGDLSPSAIRALKRGDGNE